MALPASGGSVLPQSCPIGFYFAKLWYFERLYPMVYTAAAFKALEDGCHEEPTWAKLPILDRPSKNHHRR